MITVAVVGYGLSAQVFHLPFIAHSPLYTLIAISSSQVAKVQNQHPEITVYENAEQMIRESNVDLVIITSPNGTHYPLAKLALESSKHVLLEKPMTATSEEALALAALAAKKSLVLSIYHNRRWDGDFLTLQHLLKQEELGEIKVFHSNFDRFRPQVRDRWREQPGAASGILFDLGSHLIDQTLCLFGEPSSLSANCRTLREGAATIDYFQVQLHYPHLEVVLQSSPFAAAPNSRFVLQGTKGSYTKYGLDPQEDQLRNGVMPSAAAFGIEPPASYGVKYLADQKGEVTSVTKVETIKGCYSEYYAQLATAINTNKTPPVCAMQGARVIKLIELAIHSSETGRSVSVDLSDFSTYCAH